MDNWLLLTLEQLQEQQEKWLDAATLAGHVLPKVNSADKNEILQTMYTLEWFYDYYRPNNPTSRLFFPSSKEERVHRIPDYNIYTIDPFIHSYKFLEYERGVQWKLYKGVKPIPYYNWIEYQKQLLTTQSTSMEILTINEDVALKSRHTLKGFRERRVSLSSFDIIDINYYLKRSKFLWNTDLTLNQRRELYLKYSSFYNIKPNTTAEYRSNLIKFIKQYKNLWKRGSL